MNPLFLSNRFLAMRRRRRQSRSQRVECYAARNGARRRRGSASATETSGQCARDSFEQHSRCCRRRRGQNLISDRVYNVFLIIYKKDTHACVFIFSRGGGAIALSYTIGSKKTARIKPSGRRRRGLHRTG